MDKKAEITKFCVIYDGDSHKEHKIDAITVGNSIAAIGKLLNEANKIVNGKKSEVEVLVDADFIKGSFGLNVELICSNYDLLIPLGLFAGTAGYNSVVVVIEWLKGRDIKLIIENDGANTATITASDGNSIKCDKNVSKMVGNSVIRECLDYLIRIPLSSKGTSSFCIKRNKDDAENELTIDKVQSSFFTDLSVTSNEEDIEFDSTVKFTAANINGETGWAIGISGGKSRKVIMNDDDFRKKITNPEDENLFGKLFKVKCREITITRLQRSSKSLHIIEVYTEDEN